MLIENLLNIINVIIPFLVILTILVFVHELGHYTVARMNKVKVEQLPDDFKMADKQTLTLIRDLFEMIKDNNELIKLLDKRVKLLELK